MGGKLRVVAGNVLLALLGLASIEVGARVAGVTPGSIDPSINMVPLGAGSFGRHAYPRGYFVAEPTRGFDIAKDAPLTPFEFSDGRTQVFSNRYGCFDRTSSFDGPYVLLLGDSFTWGYADYEAKWGTLLERELGLPVAKCGVTHTGQRHQLAKARDVVAAIGHAPSVIVVGHYQNDLEDDYLFPRATVVEGYLADAAVIEGGAPRHYTLAELAERYRRWASGEAGLKNLGNEWSPPSALERRSVLFAGVRRLRQQLRARGARQRMLGERSAAACDADARRANEEALDALDAWARSIGADLRVLLIPDKEMKDVYAATRRHLDAAHIAYLDLRPRFAEVGGTALYWPHDRHFSTRGNELVAGLVATWIAPALPARVAGGPR